MPSSLRLVVYFLFPRSISSERRYTLVRESGRGYLMEFKNSLAFLAGYMYDATGNPLWYLSTNTMPNAQTFQSSWTQ